MLDTDLYKFTMMQVVLHQYPQATAEYHWILRSEGVDLRPFADEIAREISQLSQCQITEAEIQYLKTLGYFKEDFLDRLRDFRFNPSYVTIKKDPEFSLEIRGPWLETILFEVPLLAIISEIVMRGLHPNLTFSEARQRLQQKIKRIQEHPLGQDLRFSDFGTRRRYGYVWQAECVQTLAAALPVQFIGTSNVHLARTLGLKPIGTMAHEFIQAHQALTPDPVQSQKAAFIAWNHEYKGQLAIALSDTFGLNSFLKDFDLRLASSYAGARQDSGNPIEWAKTILQHYQRLGIDPKTKQFVFSDALTVDKSLDILSHFHGQVQMAFGIGTHLTNDMGVKPVDMVIKMVRCNGLPVAKISDTPGKSVCIDPEYLNRLKNSLKS